MKEKKGSPCPSLSLLLYKLLQRACAHTQLNKLFASSATSMYKTLEEKKATREKKTGSCTTLSSSPAACLRSLLFPGLPLGQAVVLLHQ